jgi:hypothetical protein
MNLCNEPLKRILTALVLLISAYSFSYSQINLKDDLKLSHPINYFPSGKKISYRFSALPETLYVYGIRVQFQPDNNQQTTGDGRFDLSNSYPDSVDAPPHDSLYFLYHLQFLRNYYYKVSKGKLVIVYGLLGGVRNLPGRMEDYSPRRNENLQRLGTLFFQSWASVDSVVNFSGIDPSKSAFIIFHAGAGKDIDLASQGIFAGELDIPSIYIGLSSLKSLYGDTTRGYHTNEGVIIPSSCILPEQEYRIIESFGSQFLELGMNGIVAGSIGSHLGLPDLFDTRTGITAIGRFGLMDGQSLFSFSGVFPPEPSAWEKQYLGWIDPIELISDGTFNSRAASIDHNGNSSVFKVYISAKEYFLVENRNRDALKNGQTVYYINNGVLDSVKFSRDENGFQIGEVWKLQKSIVDVDEFDWSLPGLKNDTANFQGGILIWHIDENIIDARIANNSINIDINHRGVDLEEAKGSQDIGVVFNTPFGDFVGDGTPFDYWYSGEHYVPLTIYKNEFTPTSIPNSKSYAFLNSRVCLRNFGTIDSTVAFTYEQCGIKNINGYPRFVGIDTSINAQPIGFDFSGNQFDEVFVNVKDSLFGFRDNGKPIRVDMPNGFLKDSVSAYVVGYLNFPVNSQFKYVVGTYKNKLNLLSFTIDSLTSEPSITAVNSTDTLSTPILVIKDRLGFDTVIYAGTNNGRAAKFKLNSPGTVLYDSVSNRRIAELAQALEGTLPPIYTAIDVSYKFLASSGILQNSSELFSTPVRITSNNKIQLADNILTDHLGISNIYSSPTIAYLDKDATQDIIFSADDGLFAVNRFGVVLDNFPFRANGVSKISSGISVADIDGDGVYEVIFGTGDGRVYAYNVQGKVLDGFPLLAGKEIKSTPALINTDGKFGIVVYSTDGYLYGWKTQWSYDSAKILWKNFLKDRYHSNYAPYSFRQEAGGPCLPQDKVYNWPNPVYGKTTNIRYFLNGTASNIKIKIMDLSGELVTTLTGTVNRGFDNEVPWDVSTVQSGIYIGVVELEGGDCNETASFKIAVVK